MTGKPHLLTQEPQQLTPDRQALIAQHLAALADCHDPLDGAVLMQALDNEPADVRLAVLSRLPPSQHSRLTHWSFIGRHCEVMAIQGEIDVQIHWLPAVIVQTPNQPHQPYWIVELLHQEGRRMPVYGFNDMRFD